MCGANRHVSRQAFLANCGPEGFFLRARGRHYPLTMGVSIKNRLRAARNDEFR